MALETYFVFYNNRTLITTHYLLAYNIVYNVYAHAVVYNVYAHAVVYMYIIILNWLSYNYKNVSEVVNFSDYLYITV